MRNLQIMQNIKCQLLDLWINCAKNPLASIEYLELFKGMVFREFKIENVEFLNLKHDILYPLTTFSEGNHISKGIPYVSVAPYFEQRHQSPNLLVDQFKQYFEYAGDALVLEGENSIILGVLVLEETQIWKTFAQTPYKLELEKLISETVRMIKSNHRNTYEQKLNRELFEMTEIFHSTMDVNHILEAMIHGVKKIFPKFQSKLILSNDQDRRQIEDVYVFDYLLERPSTIESFVSGEMTVEEATDIDYRLLNAPIKGKQGIYGVLQIFAPPGYQFNSREKRFIQHLAQTSGNALENAKLYHQSHRLVSDLQLINETSQRLNMKLNKEEILSFLTKQLNKSFTPSGICFALIENNKYHNEKGTSAFFYEKEADIYSNYITNHFEKSADPLFVADFDNLIDQHVKYNSMMAVPIVIRENVQGYCAILHEEPYYFSFDSFKLMQSIIRHSSLAISNILLREQLQEMVDRDHLTKLYARKYLDRYVEKSMEVDEFGSFVLCDIDNFKQINDTFGHQTGDLILKTIAEQFQQAIQNEGICARWGGEEMAIYLPNKNLCDTIEIVNNIIKLVPETTNPSVTISSGIAFWKKDTESTYQVLFQHADVALYEAKNNGKNRYCLYQQVNA
ncbi:sensor domain-containing diguanylate cyclase [Rummeliibacillus pycnus]|uniref:sensor domain-containing diguanylate cyclase n=1 Tax=Rummeliibacillus pycnus TaxID=101070 RepID=UPI000C9CFBAA|nr:diguanylate cyclase [Rummeliibacillus pycnus]